MYDRDAAQLDRYLAERPPAATLAMPPMPQGDPRQAVQALLRAEQMLRTGTPPGVITLDHDPYWADLGRLLCIHALRSGPRDALQAIGINPSNREFTGTDGSELTGPDRRLPTLSSLGLQSWSQADHDVRHAIADACCEYFDRNPYRGWFGVLQQVIEPTGTSYYPPGTGACHLDLIPWATSRKWGTLPPAARARLLSGTAQTIAAVIARAPLAMLVLNGREIVRQFKVITGQPLVSSPVTGWDLARRDGPPVAGVSYTGTITRVAGIPLGREILIAGYNHNLQSSFGVSAAVRASISTWITTLYQSSANAQARRGLVAGDRTGR